jgi:leader peptidase (prepilin peptidase)/N-methyltransferase
MTVLLAVLIAALGLAIGSFLNVVVHRVPRGESVISPSSACPGCGAEVRPRDNIPVVSWLLLRGRCRDCREPIAWRYPVVELLTAVIFGGLALAVGPHWELPAFLYLAALGVALTAIDLDTRRLPNVLVLPSYPVALLLLLVPAVSEGRGDDLLRAVVGALVLFLGYLALALAKPGGMGFGDVKLAGLLGLYLGWLGWGPLAVGAFLGFLLGGVVGIALMVLRGASRKTAIPYGPFMLAGALVAVLWGGTLADAYAAAVLG